MKLSELLNTGYHSGLPAYYNHVTVINYNQPQNQLLATKKAVLKKYKRARFHTTPYYKPVSRML
jgi:hypothetical protein